MTDSKDSKLNINTAKSEKEFAEALRSAAEGEISLQQFLDLSNSDIESMAELANALYEEERFDDALVILEGLIALNDKDSRYFNAVGAIFIRQERFDEAIEALNVALQLDGNNIDALVNRGEANLSLAKIEESAADFEKAISLDPMEENLSANRARQLVWGMLEFFKECERQGMLEPDFEFVDDISNPEKPPQQL